MRIFKTIIASVAVMLSSLFPLTVLSAQASDYQADTLICLVPLRVDMATMKEQLPALGASVAEDIVLKNMRLVKIKTAPGKMVWTARTICQDKAFVGLQPNFLNSWSAEASGESPVVNDPQFPNQWDLFFMKFPGAWKSNKGAVQYVALLDSGCGDVGDLRGKISGGVSTLANNSLTDDAPGGGHGTKIASIIAAKTDNKIQIAAANPSAYIYSVKVGSESVCDDFHIVAGLYQAMQAGIKIVVIGAAPNTNGWSLLNDRLVYGMLKLYSDLGGLVFAPAGNGGARINATLDPALILVASTDKNGKPTNFSNYGNPVWFAAPGENLPAINNGGSLVSISGTSSSAALVAAAASLIWSKNPQLSNKDVLGILVNNASGQRQHNEKLGYGIIDVEAAMLSLEKKKK